MKANKNLLSRKLDLPEMWHQRLTRLYEQRDSIMYQEWDRLEGIPPCYLLLWKGRGRRLIPSYCQPVKCHIFCLLGMTLFADKSTVYAHMKYLPLLQNFEQISTYSWGSTTLAHLYKSLCRTSLYDCKEMDGLLDLLFVWA
ncbi:hypothetical protein Ahy_A04g018945 [Arachis hypogaea]|uniref:Aminotransferase-like plant mobile domain-containing protein n=1 Tax=Arachis hypogaea TaxID=3818 RepID=A0A445DEX6_ARAHY|nr:hypothetical protein Ahy_A04g018945 [Arachis hypogaea]